MFKPVDIKEKLVHLQKKTIKEHHINNWLQNIFYDLDVKRNDIQTRLLDRGKNKNNVFNIDHVDAKIFFISIRLNKFVLRTDCDFWIQVYLKEITQKKQFPRLEI
ncbi:hypothetical protein BSU00_04150 [Tenacibaculum sp. SG-28]|nr:hypothetical protein BSU00_04150 [Tenacibaculum sp. SG-28]